jgi:hypothetical protein
MNDATEKVKWITRANVDALLDAGMIEVAMNKPGRWWAIRRNGKTRTWKRDTSRIEIPFKAGIYTYGTITQDDFVGNCPGALRSDYYRIKGE